MNCNCGDWDDSSPCKIHENKLPRPAICWYTTWVINIARRSSNLKWFYTITKDSFHTYESPDFDSKQQVTEAIHQRMRL